MRRAVGQRLRRFRIVSIIWEADRASYRAGVYDCRLEGIVDARKSRKIPGDWPGSALDRQLWRGASAGR